jgi:hypothetical protein
MEILEFYNNYTQITITISTVIISMGLLGNVVSFLIFSRKAFSKSSINIYCRALAIFDSFMFVNVIFYIAIWYMKKMEGYFKIACKINYFFSVGVSPVSGWILVIFSIDQLINVSASATSKFKIISERKFQIWVILVLSVFHIALYLFVPFKIDIVNASIGGNLSISLCSLNSLPNSTLVEFVYLVEANFVPFILMMLTTLLIMRSLRNSTKNLLKSSQQVNSSKKSSASIDAKKSRQRKFALHSVFLNVMFILLTAPLIISMIISTGNYLYDVLIQRILSIFFFLNYSIHLLTHLGVNSIFRREFLNMITFKNTSSSSISHNS